MKNNIGLQTVSHEEVVYISGLPGFIKKYEAAHELALVLYDDINNPNVFLPFVHVNISRLKIAAITA